MPVYLTHPPIVRSGNGPASPPSPACYANASAASYTVAVFLNTTASNYGSAPGALTVSAIETTPFGMTGLVNATVRRRSSRQ